MLYQSGSEDEKVGSAMNKCNKDVNDGIHINERNEKTITVIILVLQDVASPLKIP